ncbi:MAG: DUF4256 domain-containing protein [Marinagarivorans sp.]
MKTADSNVLLATLEQRFLKNMARHPSLKWDALHAKLIGNESALAALTSMEETGGEPDVIGFDAASQQYIFCDCAAESPTGRRSLCYDQAALDTRKENKPKGSACALAAEMGIELLTEEEYRTLQTLGEFDKKTSSWITTPASVRNLGGALFCDRRYGQVFTYHNGAESYYAARGFRGVLRV